MKRTLIILVSILAVVYIALTVLGSRGEYSAEKAIFRINKKFTKIKDDPLATPEAKYKEVIEDYKSYMKKYQDSRLAPFAHILIGRTYVLKGDHDLARETFERVIQQYGDDKPSLAAQALLEIAASYSNQENVGAIVKTYERLKRDYPATEQGLAAPLTLAKIQASNNPVAAPEIFAGTIAYYRSLQSKDPKSVIGFKALNLVAASYMTQQKWREAANTYGELLLEYPQPEYLTVTTANLYLRTINTLALSELKDYDLAIKIYADFIQKYPQHPLTPLMDKLLQGGKELKQKELQSAAATTDQ